MNAALAVSTALATQDAYDPDDVTPGLLGFLIVFAIGVALWFLLKSMNGRLKRIDVDAHERDRGGPTRPDPADEDAGQPGAGQPGAARTDQT